VSTTTVLEGYRCLEGLGLIESRPQSGYFVRPEGMRRPKPWSRLPPVRSEPIVLTTADVRVPPAVGELLAQATKPGLVPLGAGLPDPSFLPSEALSIRMARIVRQAPAEVNRYCIGAGELPLRRALARWMLEGDATTEADEIVVAEGATQALLLALRSVARPGDAVAVESPGYHGFHALLQFLGLRSVEVPSDPVTGFSVDALQDVLSAGGDPVACVLLSSCFSNPTGATMPDAEKRRLVEICGAKGIPLIDDDTYGDIAFADRRPRSLKSFAPADVIHIGSFSKTLGPGYRIAWLAGGKHRGDILRCHNMAALATRVAPQRTIYAYLERGGMQRHIRRLRRQYAENLRFLQNEVARHFPTGTRTGEPQGGHFLWVELPEDRDTMELARRAEKAGISLAPGVLFSSRLHYRRFLRLNGAIVCNNDIVRAIATLGKLVGS
jgi:DNA-binding transcriptional MocR family regulator